MTQQRFAVALTLVNAALLAGIVVTQARPAVAAAARQQREQPVSGVLRARALEIVDAQGRVRASIGVMPAERVNGRDYPETVLLRLTDPASGPVVKLTAAHNGSALRLSDDRAGGVELFARDTGSFVRVTDREGRAARLR